MPAFVRTEVKRPGWTSFFLEMSGVMRSLALMLLWSFYVSCPVILLAKHFCVRFAGFLSMQKPQAHAGDHKPPGVLGQRAVQFF